MDSIKRIQKSLTSFKSRFIFNMNAYRVKAGVNAKSGVTSMSAVSELLLLAIGGVLVAVGITIVQPALNNLTTGVSPVISPGPASTAGTLIPYVSLFLILAYLVLIISVVIKAFR